MHDAVIVSAARTAVGKAPKGALSTVRPDEMAATVIADTLRRAAGVEPREIDDVILGCAMPEAEQGLNVARIASLRAGVPVEASAVTINRFCSSGLQAIAFAAERIMCGWATAIVAGGTESMSLVPMGGNKVSPNPALVDSYPDVYLTTGLVAENHVRDYGISREEQDAFALRSHQRAVAAIDAGRFTDEVVPLAYRVASPGASVRDVTFAQDEGPRRDTSMDALAKLRPAFHASGSVTAGNSSGINDAAAVVALASPDTRQDVLAHVLSWTQVGLNPTRTGSAPIHAIPKALELAGLKLEDVALFEINEAFAAQAVACARVLGLDEENVNVYGSGISLGHPIAATGARMVTSAIYELRRRGGGIGVLSMCAGGGMGAAMVIEAA